MVRHYYRLDTLPLSAFDELAFGIGLDIPGEQQAMPAHLDQHDTRRIVAAPQGIGTGMQEAESDFISRPVVPGQTQG